MEPKYTFEVDHGRNLMRIWLGGFFSPADVAEFVQERNRAHRRLRCALNDHLALVDMREMAVQSQDSVAAFQLVLSDPTFTARKLAFVITRSLARMQLRRTAASRDAAYFENVEEAERWLLRDDAGATPRSHLP